MKTVSHCVLCSSQIRVRGRGLVAPFLARRIWQRPPFAVNIAECVSCGFVFFNPRLESDEEARLYSGYRSAEYQRERQSAEPWYSKKLNDSLQGETEMAGRRQKAAELLRPYLPPSMARVLDFGGNRGELVDGLVPGAEAYVYDISGVTPLPGVRLCHNLDEARALGCDLIVNSNVLEHVGFPRGIVDQMSAIAAPGTLAFVEVPCESPFEAMAMLKRAVQECILAVTRPALALSLARPSGLFLMHEHINFYTPKSLGTLMTAAGWEIVAVDQYSGPGLVGKASVVWCLARKRA